MRAIIVGGGIGGLTTALMLHRRGIACTLYEQAETIRELGVGINTLPHAIAELDGLGLLPALDAVAIRTHALHYLNRLGQEVWCESRGLHAGHAAPQFSIHRGRLQGVIHAAAEARLPGCIRTGCRLGAFTQGEDGVAAQFLDRAGRAVASDRADVLIGADGIHSAVRRQLFPQEGAPVWNGLTLWRGATDWPVFLDGRSMIVAGGLEAKVVAYPIAPGATPETRLTNWAMIGRTGAPGAPPEREDWSREAAREAVRPHLARFALPQVDVSGLFEALPTVWEYPMCDRDPLPRWSHGRVTLLGDAAHPMYPVGSNGASQAILDAASLADALARAEPPAHALARYESERLAPTAAIVAGNRLGGPEGVIDAVERLAPDGFTDVEAVLPRHAREAIVRGGPAAVRVA